MHELTNGKTQFIFEDLSSDTARLAVSETYPKINGRPEHNVVEPNFSHKFLGFQPFRHILMYPTA